MDFRQSLKDRLSKCTSGQQEQSEVIEQTYLQAFAEA